MKITTLHAADFAGKGELYFFFDKKRADERAWKKEGPSQLGYFSLSTYEGELSDFKSIALEGVKDYYFHRMRETAVRLPDDSLLLLARSKDAYSKFRLLRLRYNELATFDRL